MGEGVKRGEEEGKGGGDPSMSQTRLGFSRPPGPPTPSSECEN